MEYGIVPKVYDVDYSFIVKNYLSPDVWEKEWTLYIYKDIEFSLQLYQIDCQDSAIWFEIRIKNKNIGYTNSSSIKYNIKNSNITVLKKQINGGIFELMRSYEKYVIVQSEGYIHLCELYEDEDDNLTKLAEEFLDSNCVSNREIRDVYIDNYVSNHRKRYTAESNYKSAHEYLMLPDYFLTFTKVVDDKSRYESCYAKISKNLDMNVIEQLMNEAQEVYEFSEEYADDLRTELEAI